MCAELPPGAFGVSGGLHRRGGRQRFLLPQSPDLACGRVVLQRLRWQRSLALYGQPPSLLPLCAWGCDLGGATMCVCLLSAGSDKPGVPGEKGLQSTSIRNHSSGEETFSKFLQKELHRDHRLKSTMYQEMEKNPPSGCFVNHTLRYLQCVVSQFGINTVNQFDWRPIALHWQTF